MKLLSVVHYFLPRHQAGTEIYATSLARALATAGHQVEIFASEDAPLEAGRFELALDEWEGLRVHRLMRSEPSSFERSYQDPAIDRLFVEVVERTRPDLVHFQHTFRLSCGMIPACREIGVPAVLTLADFWHICPPILLLRPGLELCPGPDLDACARCGNAIGVLYSGAPGAALFHAQNKLLRVGARTMATAFERAVQAAHAVKRQLPRSLVERARAIKQRRELADPHSGLSRRRDMLEARMQAMRAACAAACLLIAPSNFLRDQTLAAGLVAPEKIIHSDYGFDPGPYQNLKRTPTDHLRFGFIGTPVEHKGLHVAVAAMNLLRDLDLELLVYGDLTWFPAYARRLQRLSKNPRTRFLGRFENREVGKVLAGLDALIVPSLWPENSPLTIHEAFMAKVPAIVSDAGGMAELVQNGGGQTFKLGDHHDLARVMRELAQDPAQLARLAASTPSVKTIGQNADELLEIYRRCINEK